MSVSSVTVVSFERVEMCVLFLSEAARVTRVSRFMLSQTHAEVPITADVGESNNLIRDSP